MTLRIPERIETPRLVLRRWRPEDAPLLKDAIDASLPELRATLPWAVHEPSPLAVLAERLRGFAAAFDAGEDWVFGIFDRDETRVLGGTGLHRRLGPGALEIGYWVRTTETSRGVATEAAGALTRVATERGQRLEIHCDADNAASARIAEKLGYSLRERRVRNTATPDGRPRDTEIWAFGFS